MPESFDNPSTVRQGETRTWDVVIRQGIDSRLRTVHTAMPGRVTAVRNNSFVDVQPLLQSVMRDGTVVTLPIVQAVPVKNLGGQDWWFKGPVAIGDVGTLLVHERSLDAWIVKGGVVNPADPRMFDLSDAEFVPGLPTQDKVLPGAATDMVLHNGQAEIVVQKAGTFLIKNGSNELIAALIELANALATASTVAGGPFIPPVVTQIQDVVSKLQSLEGS